MFWRRAPRIEAPRGGRGRTVMLLENQPYPRDVRVRAEAETLTRAGFEVTVVAPRARGEPREETVAGVRVRRYALPIAGGGPLGYLAEYLVAHVQLFARAVIQIAAGARVVHLHNPPDTLFPVALLARAFGRAAIYDHHDLVPELFESRFGSRRLFALLLAAQRAAARSASVVVVTNESQRRLVVERSGRSESSVFVVRNGPRRDTLVAAPRTREGALTEPHLIYLGELAPQDGVQALPDLLSLPALRTARLTIVGDGPCRAELELRVASDPALARRVGFTGYVSHTRVPDLLADADIALDPAPGSDFNRFSTMTKIAEYLAAGLPVVAYDLVETRRTAEEAAIYVRDGDVAGFGAEVARLAADEELRATLARAARARADDLVWERSEAALLAAYEAVAARPP